MRAPVEQVLPKLQRSSSPCEGAALRRSSVGLLSLWPAPSEKQFVAPRLDWPVRAVTKAKPWLSHAC